MRGNGSADCPPTGPGPGVAQPVWESHRCRLGPVRGGRIRLIGGRTGKRAALIKVATACRTWPGRAAHDLKTSASSTARPTSMPDPKHACHSSGARSGASEWVGSPEVLPGKGLESPTFGLLISGSVLVGREPRARSPRIRANVERPGRSSRPGSTAGAPALPRSDAPVPDLGPETGAAASDRKCLKNPNNRSPCPGCPSCPGFSRWG